MSETDKSDLDQELMADEPQEYEPVTLYLTGPKFGYSGPLGNRNSPIAVAKNGVIKTDRSPGNRGAIKALMKYYACTTDIEKAKASVAKRSEPDQPPGNSDAPAKGATSSPVPAG